jgi:acetyl esterase/lipase
MKNSTTISFLLTLILCVALADHAATAEVKITPDVVYGHKLGLAMTFDVFEPADANGAAVVFMVSGGWYSRWSPAEQAAARFKPLTDKGFTVMAVRHGSSPKFSIPEAVNDVRRSIRYIRTNADRFKIDPRRIGVYGISAGGHLSLVLGTTADDGNPKARDPVDRASSRVTAVVAVVAPTDLRIMVTAAKDRLPAYAKFPALDLDMESAAKFSPLSHVTADDAPTLLIAGDEDKLVPVSHSQNIATAFAEKKVTHELMIIEGAGHGFRGDDYARSMDAMVAWFAENLAKK